jgi:hypothetical protein
MARRTISVVRQMRPNPRATKSWLPLHSMPLHSMSDDEFCCLLPGGVPPCRPCTYSVLQHDRTPAGLSEPASLVCVIFQSRAQALSAIVSSPPQQITRRTPSTTARSHPLELKPPPHTATIQLACAASTAWGTRLYCHTTATVNTKAVSSLWHPRAQYVAKHTWAACLPSTAKGSAASYSTREETATNTNDKARLQAQAQQLQANHTRHSK